MECNCKLGSEKELSLVLHLVFFFLSGNVYGTVERRILAVFGFLDSCLILDLQLDRCLTREVLSGEGISKTVDFEQSIKIGCTSSRCVYLCARTSALCQTAVNCIFLQRALQLALVFESLLSLLSHKCIVILSRVKLYCSVFKLKLS